MKNLKVLIIAIVISVILISCGKSEEVKNVEKQISSIQDVTLEKQDIIISAEDAYNNLPSDEKQDVKNYDDLQESRLELDNLIKDFSDETKYCARAIITIKNHLKDPNSIEVHKIDFNDGEHKYAQIDYSAKNSYGGLARSTYIITNDENVIISGKPDDETYLYVVDNSEGTVSLDSKIDVDYDEVMLLVDRYEKTRDKEYLGLDIQTIEESQAKIELINAKIARIELLNDINDSFMEDFEDIMDTFNDAVTYVSYNNYSRAKTEINNTIALIEEVKNKDISNVSVELSEARNIYLETQKMCTNELLNIIKALETYDSTGLEKHKKSMNQYMFQASAAAQEFIILYGELLDETY